MVRLAFLMAASLAILIGQYQVHAQHYIPAGKHTFTVYKKHYIGTAEGKCRYIYYKDEETGDPQLHDYELCAGYKPKHTVDHSVEIHGTNEKHELYVTLDCTEGIVSNYLPRIKVDGTEGPDSRYEEIFSGPVCIK